MSDNVNRRSFVKTAMGVGAALGVARPLAAAAQARVIGANDKINIGVIGVGTRGMGLLRQLVRMREAGANIEIVAVCDVYEKRKRQAQEISKAEFATLDYRELLDRKDVDAVLIATPDHWHAKMEIGRAHV